MADQGGLEGLEAGQNKLRKRKDGVLRPKSILWGQDL